MEQVVEVGLWLLGGIGGIVMLLLGWIAFMIREDKLQNKTNYEIHDKRLRKHDKIFIKHDKKFDKQHNEIKSLIEILKPKK
jgi:hypothetical protein